MTMKIVRKKGKDHIVIDTRPSKTIRKAQKRIQKRMLEIHTHFNKRG